MAVRDSQNEVETIDGRSLDATAYSPLDIISLHAATGAPDIPPTW